MLILSEADIEKLVNPAEVVTLLATALLHLEEGSVTLPERMHVDFDGNSLLLMPCRAGSFFVTKLVSLFPGNRKRDLPSIFGAVLLNDAETGRPLALLEGSSLTAWRTGAVGGVGARFLTAEGTSSVGLVGPGVQGLHQLLCVCSEFPDAEVCIYHPDPEKCEAFSRRIRERREGLVIDVVPSVDELVKKSDLIVTATDSAEPVLPEDPSLYQGKTLISVGAFGPENREIPDAVFEKLDQLVIDTSHAREESGDVRLPLESGLIQEDQVVELSEVVSGKRRVGRTVLLKSVGVALFDLAAARYFYERALEMGMGTEVKF